MGAQDEVVRARGEHGLLIVFTGPIPKPGGELGSRPRVDVQHADAEPAAVPQVANTPKAARPPHIARQQCLDPLRPKVELGP